MRKSNEYYWENKKDRTKMAVAHTNEMAVKYPQRIANCIDKTVIYDYRTKHPYGAVSKNVGQMKMSILKTDTVDALFKVDGEKIAVLNFASYKNPGGGFMIGSRAQEECLCHESFLYNVLREFEEDYYWKNRKDLNRALYRDRALYSPKVTFEHDDEVKEADVITCASPNFSAAYKFVSREENNKWMRKRIRFLLNIAKKEQVDTLILGAYGCGVFQQDPNFVAACFVEECEQIFENTNIHVVFAVIPPLPNQTNNLLPFVAAVENYNKMLKRKNK